MLRRAHVRSGGWGAFFSVDRWPPQGETITGKPPFRSFPTMFVLTPPAAGTVVALLGKAVARGADGRLRMLAVGDRVGDDEVVLTAQNGFVQIATAPAPAVHRTSQGGAAPLHGPEPVVVTPDPAAGSAALQAALRLDGLVEPAAAPARLADLTFAPAPVPRLVAVSSRHDEPDRLAPTADASRHQVAEDTALPLSLTGRDPDGAVARVFIVKVPTGGLLLTADGSPVADRTALTPAQAHELVFAPAPNFHGDPGPLQFLVEDQAGRLSTVSTVTIEVTPVNDAPRPGTLPIGPDLVAFPDPDPHLLPGTGDYRHATPEGTPVAGQVNATDVDLDPLRFGTAESPLHGQVVVDPTGRFLYTPDAGYRGEDHFVVSVDDGQGGVARSTVFVDVTAPDGSIAPAAVDARPAAAIPVGTASELPGPVALSFEDVFAWSLADPEPPATHRTDPSADVAADVLQLSSLLVGHLPVASEPALPDLRLDLGLDWGLRTSGLDLLRDGGGLPLG